MKPQADLSKSQQPFHAVSPLAILATAFRETGEKGRAARQERGTIRSGGRKLARFCPFNSRKIELSGRGVGDLCATFNFINRRISFPTRYSEIQAAAASTRRHFQTSNLSPIKNGPSPFT